MSDRHVEFECAASDMLASENLAGWSFRWNNRKTVLGSCNFDKRVIFVSRPLFDVNDDCEAWDTLCHEVAHAVAGFTARHGYRWQVEAARLGARPEPCSGTANRVAGKWSWSCEAGCSGERHRRTSGELVCGRHNLPVVWVENRKDPIVTVV